MLKGLVEVFEREVRFTELGVHPGEIEGRYIARRGPFLQITELYLHPGAFDRPVALFAFCRSQHLQRLKADQPQHRLGHRILRRAVVRD